MAVHFHPLTVKNVERETPDSVILTFDIPDELKSVFSYLPGQNITLRKNIDGEEMRRSYSICSAPFEKHLRVAVKRVFNGKFSTYVNELLKKGDIIEVLPPTGKFNIPLNISTKTNYLAIAAGSGITPIISMIKTALTTSAMATFTLVYANRSRSAIIFFDELEGLKNKFLDRFNCIYILSREQTEASLNTGRIDFAKLKELNKIIDYTGMDDTFICGPEALIFTVKEFLENHGVNPKNLHFELFTTPNKLPITAEQTFNLQEASGTSNITVQLDGRSFTFSLAFSSESILDAALKQGADLPYACKGGVCCTCRARLTQGKVRMDANYALEDDEIDKGFILTCQSHPLTEKVVIDFDSR